MPNWCIFCHSVTLPYYLLKVRYQLECTGTVPQYSTYIFLAKSTPWYRRVEQGSCLAGVTFVIAGCELDALVIFLIIIIIMIVRVLLWFIYTNINLEKISTNGYGTANTKKLYNIYAMLEQRQRRWVDVVYNVIQMFCVCWDWTLSPTLS